MAPRLRSLMLLACVLPFVTAAARALCAPGEISAVVLPQGPTLTGDLSGAVWQKAAKVADFVGADGLVSPEAPTEAYLLCDAEYLYAAFVCHEPRVEQLVTETSGRDGPVWTDDCVELVVDVANGKTAT